MTSGSGPASRADCIYHKFRTEKSHLLVEGGGAGGGVGTFGTGVRASISKPTPFIYLAFEKTDPFIYLIIRNVDLFIYCPLIFCTHLLLVLDKYRSQFI